jgi:hypothetical protein
MFKGNSSPNSPNLTNINSSKQESIKRSFSLNALNHYVEGPQRRSIFDIFKRKAAENSFKKRKTNSLQWISHKLVRSLIIFAIKYFHADPNEKRKKDNSEQSENPLQLAIKIQNREVVKALIQNRAIENLNHSEMKYTLTETVKNLDYILLE